MPGEAKPERRRAARDFWLSSGFRLVRRDPEGRLAVTEDYLRAYYARPEIHPTDESCPAEIALFEALMAAPFRPVGEAEIAAVADADTRENYRLVLAFRDRLAARGTVEAAYLDIVRGGAGAAVPPVFLDQMVHLIVRNLLDGARDPMRARAGEILFREQTASLEDGRVMLADSEIVDVYSRTGGMGGLGQLLTEAATPLRPVTLDVLDHDNRAIYWERGERFDTVVDMRFTQPANDALARVLEGWLGHLLGLAARVEPVQAIRDERWSWHVGLDAEAMRLLNALYRGAEVGEAEARRILALYVLHLDDQSRVIETMRGKPVYLALAMDADKRVRCKPQNLITNLPLKPDM